MKQIDQVGPAGEAIIDYSLFDAIKAGFGKIVFVIRKDIENDIREFLKNKLPGKVKVEFVHQELDMIPEGLTYPPERCTERVPGLLRASSPARGTLGPRPSR